MKGAVFIALCSSTLGFTTHTPTSVKVQSSSVSSSSPTTFGVQKKKTSAIFSSSTENDAVSENKKTKEEINDDITFPLSFDEMVSQASQASVDCMATGQNRQIVRILLPRDNQSGNLGQYFEREALTDDSIFSRSSSAKQNIILVPPDETWQGGIMQLYRSCVPTCREILRKCSQDVGGIPPKIIEDRSIDESGVDGCGLLLTQSAEPQNDISCFVQPTQENTEVIERISEQAKSRLVMLVNPQWRNVDDGLDTISKSENQGFLGKFASFLGGKGATLQTLDRLGYSNAYTIEGYVCKGGNIRLLKRFDSDWIVFAENDAMTDFIKVGTSVERPTYQDCDEMLDKMGISLKYARDVGLAPKLE